MSLPEISPDPSKTAYPEMLSDHARIAQQMSRCSRVIMAPFPDDYGPIVASLFPATSPVCRSPGTRIAGM